MGIIIRKPPTAPNSIVPINFVPDALQRSLPIGLALPLTVNNNKWATLGGVKKVQQDIYMCIMTPIGRHLMQPDYGSLIPQMLFEIYDVLLGEQMILTVKNSLKSWMSSMITVKSVTIDISQLVQNQIFLNITYVLNGTNAQNTVSLAFVSDDTTDFGPGVFQVNARSLFGV